jgi:hypothetical protein
MWSALYTLNWNTIAPVTFNSGPVRNNNGSGRESKTLHILCNPLECTFCTYTTYSDPRRLLLQIALVEDTIKNILPR